MMALYNQDELDVKLVESQGELKFECYKRDSVITGSFITKFHCTLSFLFIYTLLVKKYLKKQNVITEKSAI